MSPLEPIADALLIGRDFTEAMAHDHFHQFKQPTTVMARAHTMRSVVQALVLCGSVEGFSLVDQYLSFGRVEVVHNDEQRHYLLKARSALPLETSFQGSLFDKFGDDLPLGTGPLELLLYRFANEDLTLATVPVESLRLNGRLRFLLLGDVEEAGSWSSVSIPGVEPFDQGLGDDFGDLSDDVRILGVNEE